MAGPGGKSAGRVSVRVVPDATGFGADLKATLDRIERGLEVHVSAVLDDGRFRAQLAQIQNASINLNATVNTTQVRQQVNSLQRSGGAVNLPVQLQGAQVVRLELIRLATNRVVDLVVNVNKRSLATAGAALAALSGGRSATGYLRGIGAALGNLDKSIPRIGLLATSIAAVGAAGLASVSGTLSLASSLVTVAGAGIALPGILAGIGIAGGTLALALHNVGAQLGDLTPKFQALQLSVAKDFFAQAEGPIRSLVSVALPALRAGLGDVATSLGGFAATAANAFKGLIQGGGLTPLFANTAKAIDNVKTAIQPVISAFSTLATVGSSYLPALGTAIGNVATRFNGFIQGAASSGALTDWINTGLAGLKSLASVAGSVGGILKGLFTAANAATGGNGLAVFATGLQQISAAVNSSGLQNALTTIFSGAQQGAQGLASAIKPIGGLLSSLAPTLSGVFATAGQTIGRALGAIASALSQPAFARGLTGFFAGVTTGVNAILPVLPTLATAFGQVLGTAGQVAAQLGPVLAASFAAIAPVVTSVLTALQPLIPIIGTALSSSVSILAVALQALAPVFAAVLAAVAPLIPMLAAGLSGAIQVLAPAVLTLVQAIGGALPGVIAAIVATVGALAPILAQVMVAIAPLVPAILSLIPPLLQIVTAVLPLIPALVAQIVPLVLQLVPLIVQILAAVMPLVPSIIQLAIAFVQMAGAIQGGVFAALSALAGLLPSIVAAISGLLGVITAFVMGAVALFTGNFSAIPGIVSGAISAVRGFIASGFAGALAIVASFVASAIARVVSFGSSIVSTISSAISSFVAKISSGISQAVSLIASLPGKAKAALGNLAGMFVSAGADLIRGLINGVQSGVGALVGAVSSAAHSALAAAKGALGIKSPSTVFRDEVGAYIPAGIVAGIQAKQRVLDSALAGMVKVPDVAVGRVAGAAAYASDTMASSGSGRQLVVNGDIVNTDVRALVEQVMREFRLQDAAAAGAGW